MPSLPVVIFFSSCNSCSFTKGIFERTPGPLETDIPPANADITQTGKARAEMTMGKQFGTPRERRSETKDHRGIAFGSTCQTTFDLP